MRKHETNGQITYSLWICEDHEPYSLDVGRGQHKLWSVCGGLASSLQDPPNPWTLLWEFSEGHPCEHTEARNRSSRRVGKEGWGWRKGRFWRMGPVQGNKCMLFQESGWWGFMTDTPPSLHPPWSGTGTEENRLTLFSGGSQEATAHETLNFYYRLPSEAQSEVWKDYFFFLTVVKSKWAFLWIIKTKLLVSVSGLNCQMGSWGEDNQPVSS